MCCFIASYPFKLGTITKRLKANEKDLRPKIEINRKEHKRFFNAAYWLQQNYRVLKVDTTEHGGALSIAGLLHFRILILVKLFLICGDS